MKREKEKFNKAKHESDMVKFRKQLAQYGLKVVEMGGDGNCLFRTIADQLEGNEKAHRKYRTEACQFIEANKEDYAPFIEDDETIDQYLSDMIKDGTWGGQLELQVLSLFYKFNYIVHQVDNPIMAFSSFDWGTVPTIHLSYHLGEHYNSVRLLEDPCNGPPLPIGHELKQKENKAPENEIIIDQNVQSSNDTASSNELPTRHGIIQYALMMAGYSDQEIMEKALDDCFGQDEVLTYDTIDSALVPLQSIYEEIECKLLEKNFDKKLNLKNEGEDEKQQSVENVSKENDDPDKKSQNQKEEELKKLQSDDFMVDKNGKIVSMPKKNKKCECGSRKQYKNCQCYIEDLGRKTEYIEKLTKKIEANKPKANNILLL